MTSKTSTATVNAEHGVLIEALKELRAKKASVSHRAEGEPDAKACARADVGIYLIDELLRYLDVAETGIKESEEVAQQPARVGIRMEGGVIQDVFADQPVVVDVIDYDEDEVADAFGDGVTLLEQDDGAFTECVLRRSPARVMPGEFAKIDAAMVGMQVAA